MIGRWRNIVEKLGLTIALVVDFKFLGIINVQNVRHS